MVNVLVMHLNMRSLCNYLSYKKLSDIYSATDQVTQECDDNNQFEALGLIKNSPEPSAFKWDF